MTQYLPPNLLALFSARPPIPFKPPVDKLKKRKNAQPYSGISDFISSFEEKPPAPATRGETREEKDARRKREREIKTKEKLEEKLASWDPHTDSNAGGDPFKTLFVGRINYDTSETKLRRELEQFGPVRRIQMVYNVRTRKPRGYAFVEFEHEKDMHSAYKHADGKKIDGRRILVDVERGRTVKSWRPRRLGGGLGGTRIGGPDDNIRHSGRVEQWERERGKKEERRRSRSPRDRSERRGDREKPREDKPRDDKPRDDKPRDDKPRDDKPRDDKPRDDKPRDDKPRDDKPRDDKPRDDKPRDDKPRDRGDRDKDRKRDRGGDEKDRGGERPKRSREDEKKEEGSDEKKDRRDRDGRKDRDGGRDRKDRGDREKDRAAEPQKEEPAEEAAGEGGDSTEPAENHANNSNGDDQQVVMGNSNGEVDY